MKEICKWLIFVLVVIIGFWFYYNIFFPSQLSVQTSCISESIEDMENYLNSKGYVLSGVYNSSSQNITIYDSSNSLRTNKHEYCHYIQDIKGRKHNNCMKPLGMYFNEMECYFSPYLPNFVYNWVYRE